MGTYTHLSFYERVQIEVLLKQNYSHSSIGKSIRRDQTTISREIKRHTRGKEIYLANRAQDRAERTAYYQRYKAPLKSRVIWNYVMDKLKLRWSPELIAGRMLIDLEGASIHPETIYRCIYSERYRHLELYNYLPRKHQKRRKKYGRKAQRAPVANRTMIDERPASVGNRELFGNWETDNMEGKKSDKQVVSVTVERKSRYAVADITRRNSASKTKKLTKRLRKLIVNTITTDNGSENAEHEIWSKQLQADVYFCRPYAPWEKGSVENTIGWIRRYIKKRSTLNDLTNRQLQWVVSRYNNTPKKVLNFLTPKEVFMRESAQP